MRAMFIIAGLVLGLAAAQAQGAPAPDAPGAVSQPVPAQAAAAPSPETVPAPPANPPMTGPQLLIQTSMGDITLQLDTVRAPASVANILRLTRAHHYDGTVFYRVEKGFVIQMGSWDANGEGRGIIPHPVPLEANNGLKNLRGAVSLARGEAPDSAAAEFFIVLSDNAALDHKPDDTGNTTGYAVFGQVASGMDVVDRIAQVPVGQGKGPMPDAAPNDPILISRVSVIGDPPPRPAAASGKKRRK